MNQVILQLFSRLNVLFLSNDQIVFSSAWDYTENTLNTVYSLLGNYKMSGMRVIVKTTVVENMEESYQLLEELLIGGAKHYCVMDKHDYNSIVNLAKELHCTDLLFYSSLDYYRFLTKGLFMFLDEFSDREVAAYVFDGDSLLEFDYATTSSAEAMISGLLKKYEVQNIWNMAKFSIPIPEMENVINFSELSEEHRTALSPSFVTLRVKPSRVVDINSMLSTISNDKSSHKQTDIARLDLSFTESPHKSDNDKPSKTSLFGRSKSVNAQVFQQQVSVAVEDPPEGIFDFSDFSSQPDAVNDMWSLPPTVNGSEISISEGAFDFSSFEFDSSDHGSRDHNIQSSNGSLFDFSSSPASPVFVSTTMNEDPEDQIKVDSYDEVVHGKRAQKVVDVYLSDVIPQNKTSDQSKIFAEPDREIERNTNQFKKFIYYIIVIVILFLLYNFMDTQGYLDGAKEEILDLYESKLKPMF